MNLCDLVSHNYDFTFCIYETVYHYSNMKYDLINVILTMT